MNPNQPTLTPLLKEHVSEGLLSEKYSQILHGFIQCYELVLLEKKIDPKDYIPVIETYLRFLEKDIKSPYAFEYFHKQILSPNYHAFGKDFIRPLIDEKHSTVTGLEALKQIDYYIKANENVILLANHQIEADPQVLAIMLEEQFSKLSQEMIFVAGERVTTDPLAVPFSLGCNLFCIYSKKYIDNPIEKKHEKQLHNKKTMQVMRDMLSEGGRCIYVAPSGGRDRPNQEKKVQVALLDPQSIEMFYLMAKKAARPTHFFPLSLATYSLLPPPEETQIELGETRVTKGGAVHLHFGDEIDMVNFPGNDLENKIHNRKARAKYIYDLINKKYQEFPITY